MSEASGFNQFIDTPNNLIDQLVDLDPQETAEWKSSLDSLLKAAGPTRARYIMLSLLQHAQENKLGLERFAPPITSTQSRPIANQSFPATNH